MQYNPWKEAIDVRKYSVSNLYFTFPLIWYFSSSELLYHVGYNIDSWKDAAFQKNRGGGAGKKPLVYSSTCLSSG